MSDYFIFCKPLSKTNCVNPNKHIMLFSAQFVIKKPTTYCNLNLTVTLKKEKPLQFL